MATEMTSMRLDEEAKAGAKQVLEELGMNLSSAVNIFLKAVVRKGGIPFDVTLDKEERRVDFAAEYLAPLMSDRNEIHRVNANTERIRGRLKKRNAQITAKRRKVA